MTTKDFVRYNQTILSAFMRPGIKGQVAYGKLHTPEFCADTQALEYNISNLCALIIIPHQPINC